MSRRRKTKRLVSRGAEFVGGAVGGALGFFTGGPVGAAIGGAAGPLVTWALQRIGRDFAGRQLSPREEVRVGAGLIFGYNKVKELLSAGRVPRNDDFFEQDVTGRSASDEILEGVILKCRDEPEENKCKYIVHIYANVAFTPDISAQSANYLLRLAEQLTYRQLCLITLAKRGQELSLAFAWGQYLTSTARGAHPDQAFIAELRGMEGLIHAIGNTGQPPFLEKLGLLCYETMDLDEIPPDELRAVAALIRMGSG